jgi:hypothetical protein|tara:strand:+ start:816 stop:1100 length:285 start_codon:yes stop_codon:yes gene_type:complete
MTASEMLELKDKYPDKFRVLEDRLYETDRNTIITRLITSVVLMGLDKDIIPDYRLIEMYIIALPVENLEDILKEIGKDIDESRQEEIANGEDKQ